MAVSYLAGTAVTAAIVCNHAVAVTEKKQHLRVPVVGGQRPTVAEHDGLALAPVFIKTFNAALCFDKAHVTLPDISVQMNVVLLLYAFVNKLGEEGGVDHELAPLCVVRRGRFSRHRLFQRSSCFLQCCDVITNSHQHV